MKTCDECERPRKGDSRYCDRHHWLKVTAMRESGYLTKTWAPPAPRPRGAREAISDTKFGRPE